MDKYKVSINILGDKFRYLNFRFHRDDGPAIEYDGIKQWYLHGKRHRVGGPAVEYFGGAKEWHLRGIKIGSSCFKHHKSVGYHLAELIADKCRALIGNE